MHRGRIAAAAVWFGAIALAQTSVLTPGSPIERDIRAGESHAYRLTVDAGKFVYLTAAQLGIDLSIHLKGPDNKPLFTDRMEYGGYEDLPWIAPTSGEVAIEIKAGSFSPVGRYRLQVEIREPTAQ